MYKHWEEQKKLLVDIISKKGSASCQVCYGTNYSIFFRNLHSDLLLKRSAVPIYIDLEYLSEPSTRAFLTLLLSSLKRTLVEKKMSVKASEELFSESTHSAKIYEIIKEVLGRNSNCVFFVEDIGKNAKIEHEIFNFFEEMKRSGLDISVIYLMKVNIMHPSNITKFHKVPHIYENILYFPIVDMKLLKSTEKGIAPKTFDVIYKLTGGVDRFYGIAIDLKNNLALRERKNTHKHVFENLHLRDEIGELWESLSHTEVKALANVVWGCEHVEAELKHDLDHLEKLGILSKDSKGYVIVIGLLKSVGLEKSLKNSTVVELSRNKLLINGKAVSIKLTVLEKKILKQFLTNKNKIVGRSTVAKSFPSNGKTPDEVIDKAVDKLRGKLSDMWVNPNNIVSIAGRGFLYKESA